MKANVRVVFIWLVLVLVCQAANAQGLFEDKYKGCLADTACVYCGDSMAYYPGNLTKYIVDKIEHSVHTSMYELRSFDVFYEVFVDSSGTSCVVSFRSMGASYSWLLRDDIRKWLTGLPGWHPAVKDGHPINSTLIIEAAFRNNFLGLSLAGPPEPKKKRKQRGAASEKR